MAASRVLASIAVLVCFGPVFADEAYVPHEPVGVITFHFDMEQVVVEWRPGEEIAHSYRVYGISGSNRTILFDSSQSPAPEVFFATVEAGYAAYAVSGMKGGVESNAVLATSSSSLKCVTVELTPPGVSHRCGPSANAYSAVFP